eukprot:1599981-Alexandrium_andersonii.AAC.1
MLGPKFGPRDLPRFGALVNSGAILLNASCQTSDLQAGWASLGAKNVEVDEAMGAVLTMEN